MVRFHSYLAGSAFALLLGANIAMELLHAYPASQHLWHVNLVFAREARPLLQYIDVLTGGGSSVTILALGGLAVLCIAAARAKLRLVAAVNCHIALVMFVFLGARSYVRTFPRGLPSRDVLVSLATGVSMVQLGMCVFIVLLSAACVQSQSDIIGRAVGAMRRRGAAPARQATSGRMLGSKVPLESDLRPSSG